MSCVCPRLLGHKRKGMSEELKGERTKVNRTGEMTPTESREQLCTILRGKSFRLR